MNIFLALNFERPWLLVFLLWAILATSLYLYFKPKNTNFVATDLIQQVYKKNTLWFYIFNISVFSISVLSVILLWWIYGNLEKQIIKKEWIDIQIVLDMSYSMIAEDIRPRRIDAAKQMLSQFVWEIDSDRIGIILFSGKPFQSVPLTYDYDFLQSFIADISVDIVNQSTNVELAGTALGDGLVLASDVLTRENQEREKVIILITDGEANKWVKPELALKLLKQKWIKTYTIWVGKWEDTTINIPIWNFIQQIQVSWVDEEILQKISNETGASYYRADSSEVFRNILETIARLEKTDLEYEIYTTKQHYDIFILWFIFLLLVPILYIYFYKNIRL